MRAGWHSDTALLRVADRSCRIAHGDDTHCQYDNDCHAHGLGNEFGATTNITENRRTSQNIGSSKWWHDASVDQADCHVHRGGLQECIVQGTDHGTGLNDGPMLGQYAIYTGTFSGVAPGEISHGR